jgi:hypothetical protein
MLAAFGLGCIVIGIYFLFAVGRKKLSPKKS